MILGDIKKQAALRLLVFLSIDCKKGPLHRCSLFGEGSCALPIGLALICRHKCLDVLDCLEDIGGQIDRLFLGDHDIVFDADTDALFFNVKSRLNGDDHARTQGAAGW